MRYRVGKPVTNGYDYWDVIDTELDIKMASFHRSIHNAESFAIALRDYLDLGPKVK
jgi:hypothetical protein